MVICVNFVARRFKKTRATETHNDGQQNLSARATKFQTTDNEICTHAHRYFAKVWHIDFSFFIAYYIYAYKKKKFHI